jgi:hypothetical protein
MDALVVGTQSSVVRGFFFGCRMIMELVVVPVVFGAVIETISAQLDIYDHGQQAEKDQTPPRSDEFELYLCGHCIGSNPFLIDGTSYGVGPNLQRTNSTSSDSSLP